ncbi:hypothetical protein MBM_00518 [Drepanopeziza brunnea f. sp. 'multigermtubi' MB_m1]|uniref:Uncharacterized protein n=1 Tax=Marssonina brunnea f. sp. multigermtubi (strain MB_m1) TaxID=1072389 RepID=K1WUQ0_MARBU|nr:uncharacterized protein MBM_00518 [Drepanopeziza brunnea f. sp. 'multigermtubi' MB_m1]EKD21405.1 hypothetical protein MBM_00518 [Drepanopeziza brunnea f. sp. 'multigermtubi' MB_m1]
MSGLKNLFLVAFPTKQKPAQDVEHAPTHHGNLEPPSNLSSVPTHDDFSRPDLDPSDSLNMFRHLTDILSHTSMAHSDGTLASGRRPAANLGITTRASAVESVATGVEEYRDRAERMEHMFGDKVKDLATEIGQRARMAEQVVHDTEARERVAVDGAVKEAKEQLERLEESARRKLGRPLTINVSHTGRGSI